MWSQEVTSAGLTIYIFHMYVEVNPFTFCNCHFEFIFHYTRPLSPQAQHLVVNKTVLRKCPFTLKRT